MDSGIWQPILEQFSNGDPKFLELMIEQIELYSAKNKDYASGEDGEDYDPNGNFNRVSTILALYPGLSLSDPRVYALALLMKQFDQVLWSMSRGYEGEIEGLDAKLQDIVVYFMIIRCINAHMTGEDAPEQVLIPSVWTLPFDQSGITVSFQCSLCGKAPCMCFNGNVCMGCGFTACQCTFELPEWANNGTIVEDGNKYYLT